MLQGIPESQWRYYRHWLIFVLIAEAAMLAFIEHLPLFYGIIAVCFVIGFLLRITKLYPGEAEPLALDLSVVAITLVYAALARVSSASGWQYLLIFSSSMIILPHIIYIAAEK